MADFFYVFTILTFVYRHRKHILARDNIASIVSRARACEIKELRIETIHYGPAKQMN